MGVWEARPSAGEPAAWQSQKTYGREGCSGRKKEHQEEWTGAVILREEACFSPWPGVQKEICKYLLKEKNKFFFFWLSKKKKTFAEGIMRDCNMKKSQTQDIVTTFGGTMRWNNKGDLEGGDRKAEEERETGASKKPAPGAEAGREAWGTPGTLRRARHSPRRCGPSEPRHCESAVWECGGSSQGHRASSLSLGVSFPQSVQQAGGRQKHSQAWPKHDLK